MAPTDAEWNLDLSVPANSNLRLLLELLNPTGAVLFSGYRLRDDLTAEAILVTIADTMACLGSFSAGQSFVVLAPEHVAILAMERAETDKDLLTERARTDSALAMRDEFLGVVSHELRNQLNSMVLFATLIGEEVAALTDPFFQISSPPVAAVSSGSSTSPIEGPPRPCFRRRSPPSRRDRARNCRRGQPARGSARLRARRRPAPRVR